MRDGVERRRRADDDRVEATDDRGEIGLGVLDDVESPPQQLETGARDRLADEDALAPAPQPTRAASWYASSARATATPCSIGAPRSTSSSLDRRERGRDVEHVVVADMADAEHPRSELSVRACDGDAEAVAQLQHELLRVDAVGRENRGDDCGSLLVGREELEPHRLHALAARAPERRMARVRRVESLLQEESERGVGAMRRAVTAGVNGVEPDRERLSHPLPVEVVPRRRRARGTFQGGGGDGAQREPRRGHECLLRPGDDDVETPGVRLQRDGAEARDCVHDGQRPALLRGSRERLNVRDDTCRRLGMHEDDDLRARLRETRAKVVRLRRLTPGVPEARGRPRRMPSPSSTSGRRRPRPSRRARARRATGRSRAPTRRRLTRMP